MKREFPLARSWAEVDLGLIRHNFREIKKRLSPQVRFMAVVKADAYGHGAAEVARATLEEGAAFLGVATVEEALALRQAGFKTPILLLGPPPLEAAGSVVEQDIAATIFSLPQAEALAREAFRQKKIAKVHIKVDTGMGRIGLRGAEEVLSFCRKIAEWPLFIEGIFTHFACADEVEKAKTAQQLEGFLRVIKKLEEEGLNIPLKHAANSAATLEYPPSHLDMVRVGIALYGYHPRPGASGINLKPALTWKAKITQVKRVPPGTPISYGWTYKSSGEEIIATVPVGYADGYRRILSNRGWVLVQGKRAPVVGRVCMDQFMIRLEEEVAPGTEVILLGRQGEEAITADEMASWLDTISYEVLTSIGRRVPRVYKS
ncbi:alanine racemase [Thermanaeromonas toyohensis ToBE]|uniref:Alanine racemase n=1 Tax=Thermanaeromonas toyohensis ToBE TaxID=698762 RepID=A0A1W1V715_9FIRM|nr:alanine racemase [Thermanaeromonas toyohensis]SMB89142.1 alanine racemase [Thermanaeromonas toyohensis ToBE]